MKFYRPIAWSLLACTVVIALMYIVQVGGVEEWSFGEIFAPVIALVAVTISHMWISMYASIEVVKSIVSVLYAEHISKSEEKESS